MAAYVLLTENEENHDVLDILVKFFPRKGVEVDRNRDDDMLEEIQAQLDDSNW
jgi:hypothetical protein